MESGNSQSPCMAGMPSAEQQAGLKNQADLNDGSSRGAKNQANESRMIAGTERSYEGAFLKQRARASEAKTHNLTRDQLSRTRSHPTYDSQAALAGRPWQENSVDHDASVSSLQESHCLVQQPLHYVGVPTAAYAASPAQSSPQMKPGTFQASDSTQGLSREASQSRTARASKSHQQAADKQSSLSGNTGGYAGNVAIGGKATAHKQNAAEVMPQPDHGLPAGQPLQVRLAASEAAPNPLSPSTPSQVCVQPAQPMSHRAS